jgi:hypothetical protein
VNLKVPIVIFDELLESVIKSTGSLDLDSGEIRNVEYEDYDVEKLGLPAENEEYEFTSGNLSHNGKDVEFSIVVDVFTGKYAVSANELMEIKLRAAKLFSGMGDQAIADAAPAKKTASAKRKKAS